MRIGGIIRFFYFWISGEDKDHKSENAKRGKIATNAHAVPKEHLKG